VGKRIRLPLGFFAPQKGTIIYFVPKGSLPEIYSEKSHLRIRINTLGKSPFRSYLLTLSGVHVKIID
jgi:hypothetical protein